VQPGQSDGVAWLGRSLHSKAAIPGAPHSCSEDTPGTTLLAAKLPEVHNPQTYFL